MKTYQTILIGGTYYAFGYAAGHPDCLILEESQILGGDFHHNQHPVDMSAAGSAEEETELAALEREYGVWNEDGFDLLKAAPVLHEYASRQIARGLNILIDVRILSVEKEDGRFVVTYMSNEGIRQAAAKNLLDTTVERTADPAHVRCTGKTLNVFTVCNGVDFDRKLLSACPDCRILPGFQENEKLMLFPAAPQEDMLSVYQRLVDTWKQAFPAGEEKILFVADGFDGAYEAQGAGDIPWNGGRFANPLTAFVQGKEA